MKWTDSETFTTTVIAKTICFLSLNIFKKLQPINSVKCLHCKTSLFIAERQVVSSLKSRRLHFVSFHLFVQDSFSRLLYLLLSLISGKLSLYVHKPNSVIFFSVLSFYFRLPRNISHLGSEFSEVPCRFILIPRQYCLKLSRSLFLKYFNFCILLNAFYLS